MPKGDGWSGHAVTKARRYMRAQLPQPCHRCGSTVNGSEAWVVAHVIARWQAPDLMHEPSNWAVEHRTCSDQSASAEQAAAARGQRRNALGPTRGLNARSAQKSTNDRVSSGGTPAGSVGSSRVDLQACKLEYSIVSPK